MFNEAVEACLDTPLAALRRALADDPDVLFLDFSGDAWTYARFAAEVATICDTNPDVVLMWYATSMIGAIHVPINTSYKGEFLRHQLADCGAGIVMAEGE
jgi:carnitine-CoA ligase